MSEHAVCYVATEGYLFQTVLSAIQARSRADTPFAVYICFLGDRDSEEARQFAAVCDQNDIELVVAPLAAIGGLAPIYARLFLDKLLPPSVGEILYLDGDTQIVGDISPLVYATPPLGGALAVRDPMVLIRQVSPRLRRKIDDWWENDGIPAEMRDRYVNSGVLRVARDDLESLRTRVVSIIGTLRRKSTFPDQDAINIALDGRVGLISIDWNFPGFMLNTQIAKLAQPRIIHFMSDPRPWNAALPPWGLLHHEPYRNLVHQYPGLARYWLQTKGLTKAKYVVQQWYKHLTERRSWQSAQAAVTIRDLELDVCGLPQD